jgi:hypothetical protein
MVPGISWEAAFVINYCINDMYATVERFQAIL